MISNSKSLKPKPTSTAQKAPVFLKQKGESQVVRLKSKNAIDSILINLNWQTDADLDLGCFYEMNANPQKTGFFASLLSANIGQKNVIDGLQFSRGRGGPKNRVTAQGCYSAAPFIWHTGDDRSGSSAAGESILLNPQGLHQLKRMTIYTFIYEGVPRWNHTDAIVTVQAPGNPDIVVEMGRQTSGKNFAAIAGLEFFDDDAVRVTKLMSFHDGHADCDRAYGWGLQWHSGGK